MSKKRRKSHSDSTIPVRVFPAAYVPVIFELPGVLWSEYVIANYRREGLGVKFTKPAAKANYAACVQQAFHAPALVGGSGKIMP